MWRKVLFLFVLVALLAAIFIPVYNCTATVAAPGDNCSSLELLCYRLGICSQCKGTGQSDFPCQTCNGTGRLPNFNTRCPICNGSGFARCWSCQGTGRGPGGNARSCCNGHF